MSDDFITHLQYTKFDEYLKKLKKKLKNKKIIIYGAGSFFKYIQENYDLSELNIIGISDMKFSYDEEGQEYLGYKMIPKERIRDYEPDCVIVAVLRYVGIIEDFEVNLFSGTKIKVYPITRTPFWDFVKWLWR